MTTLSEDLTTLEAGVSYLDAIIGTAHKALSKSQEVSYSSLPIPAGICIVIYEGRGDVACIWVKG